MPYPAEAQYRSRSLSPVVIRASWKHVRRVAGYNWDRRNLHCGSCVAGDCRKVSNAALFQKVPSLQGRHNGNKISESPNSSHGTELGVRNWTWRFGQSITAPCRVNQSMPSNTSNSRKSITIRSTLRSRSDTLTFLSRQMLDRNSLLHALRCRHPQDGTTLNLFPAMNLDKLSGDKGAKPSPFFYLKCST